jgi:hypothetical protein
MKDIEHPIVTEINNFGYPLELLKEKESVEDERDD